MRTSSSLAYEAFAMKTEYQRAVNQECKGFTGDSPLDYGCIDAPRTMPSGSVYSYEFKPGLCFGLGSGFSREFV